MPLASILAVAFTAQTPFPSVSVTADLKQVANVQTFLKTALLDEEHRAMLAKNQFFVAPADMPELHYVYGENDYSDIPSIVTTDTGLHLFHLTFDATLRVAEQRALYPRAMELTKKMIMALSKQTREARSPAQTLAETRALAYFGVADRLFGQNTPLPKNIVTLVDRELQLIKDKRGFEPSNIVPNKIDFTQFIARGHYTKTPKLGKYFQGMMWYGLAPIEIRDKDGKPREEGCRIAVVIADALKRAQLQTGWQSLYEPTTLFAGTVNSLTPLDAIAVRSSQTGRPDSLNWSDFSSAMAKRDPALYKANIKLSTGVSQGVQMKFMGQRGLLDGWVISRVTDQDRPLPTGLDVMAALGSKTALDLTRAHPTQFNPRGWGEYAHRQMDTIARLAALAPSEWSRNLYTGWLNVLRAKVTPPSHAVPTFMKTEPWSRQSLVTALTSWAQLRHDTILYGEQTAVEMGDGEEEQPYVKGFVEPNLPVWERLSGLVSLMKTGLSSRGMLDKDSRQDLEELGSLLAFLKSCVQKELAGKPLTKNEHTRIRKIEGEVENITTTLLMRGLQFNTLTEDDRDMALVADIHSADPLAFTVACGHTDDLIAIVPIDGKQYLARGPVFSYYEFTVPMSERMTDEKWKAQLKEGKAPARPFWTAGVLAKNKARQPIE